ncbi:hypothetical protein Tco_0666987 [Tanacetum coccineum]
MNKSKLIKVVHEEATKAGVDPKILSIAKGVITFYRGDRWNVEVHNPSKYGDFGVTELDELAQIIQKKKNKVVGELVTYLGKRYNRLKKIPEELGINLTLPTPGQVLSLTSRRKKKIQELEPETRILGLEI